MKANQANESLEEELFRLRSRVSELEQSELELRHVKDELQSKEQLLHFILNNSPNVILVKNLNHQYVLINRLYEKLFNLQPGWILGRTDYDIFPREVAANCIEFDRQIMESGKAVTYEMQVPLEDGVHTYFENKFPLFNQEGQLYGIAAISTDITELKNTEESLRKREAELRQSQKMEAVGRLAGGIAHDFNNLLTVILGYADLILLQLPENDALYSDVVGIKNEGERAALLVRQLLAFSRQSVLQPRVINLNEVIGSLTKLLKRLINEDVELITNLDANLGNIKADQSQLEQVIINLAVNARDAMFSGGKLILETSNVELSQDYADNHLYANPSQYIVLAVSDTGQGIPDELKTKIFEPFFTTKAQGQGTGLGLSTVYGIVKQSGGGIEVYSEPNKGTTFKIYLPLVNEQKTASIISPQTSSNLSGTETILLVEDDSSIRQLIAKILLSHGYRILEASRPKEALQICKDAIEPIHLVLTDVVMPEMYGPDMVKQIQQTHPDTHIIYMSGYTQGALSSQNLLEAEANLISKPFTSITVLSKIRSVFGNPKI